MARKATAHSRLQTQPSSSRKVSRNCSTATPLLVVTACLLLLPRGRTSLPHSTVSPDTSVPATYLSPLFSFLILFFVYLICLFYYCCCFVLFWFFFFLGGGLVGWGFGGWGGGGGGDCLTSLRHAKCTGVRSADKVYWGHIS